VWLGVEELVATALLEAVAVVVCVTVAVDTPPEVVPDGPVEPNGIPEMNEGKNGGPWAATRGTREKRGTRTCIMMSWG
jgi:hypothetical protein